MTTKLAATTLVISALFLAGCAATDGAYRKSAGVMNPERNQLHGGLKWLTPPTSMGLRPVSPDKMTVYLRVVNSSGTELPSLKQTLASNFEQAGYRITDNIDDAHFYLVADTRFYGENRQKDGGGALLTGAAVGGVAGAVIGHNVGSGHIGTGAVAGAALGAAALHVIANRNKMVEINLAVDLRIGERTTQTVKTLRKTDTSAETTHSERVLAEGGRDKGTTTQTQSVETQDDFLFHTNRVVAHVRKMGLTADEALPFLQQRLSSAVGSVLP